MKKNILITGGAGFIGSHVIRQFVKKYEGYHIYNLGFAWLDTGTHEALAEATEFVKALEKRTGLKIACLEEIAINYNWIDKAQVMTAIKNLKGDYYEYLINIINRV